VLRELLFLLGALLPDEDVVLLLVVVEAEAVARAEGHQLPLRVQREGGDHGGGLALDQSEGLEARREQHRLLSHVQLSVALMENKKRKNTFTPNHKGA